MRNTQIVTSNIITKIPQRSLKAGSSKKVYPSLNSHKKEKGDPTDTNITLVLLALL
jgi:hypothetical protein